MFELIESKTDMPGRVRSGFSRQPDAPVGMLPLEVHRVDRVLLTLKPVAGQFGEHDLDEAVLPAERFPVRHQWCRVRTEISPDQAGMGLDAVSFDRDAIAEPGLGRGDVF